MTTNRTRTGRGRRTRPSDSEHDEAMVVGLMPVVLSPSNPVAALPIGRDRKKDRGLPPAVPLRSQSPRASPNPREYRPATPSVFAAFPPVFAAIRRQSIGAPGSDRLGNAISRPSATGLQRLYRLHAELRAGPCRVYAMPNICTRNCRADGVAQVLQLYVH